MLRREVGAPRRAALWRAGLALCAAMALTVLALFMDERAPAPTVPSSAPTAAIGVGLVPDPMPLTVQVPDAGVATPPVGAPAARTAPADIDDAAASSVALASPVQGVLLPHDALRPAGEGYQLQLGVFADAANALVLYERLSAAGFEARIQSRVVLGPFPDRRAAEQAQADLRRTGEPAGILLPPRGKR